MNQTAVGLRLDDTTDGALEVWHHAGDAPGDRAGRGVEGAGPLLRYVYVPTEEQRESPRPYFHPLHTLGGDLVSLYRPHDHVWHKGLSFALPNVGSENFWGGPTFRRGDGYVALPNNGTTRHDGFDRLETDRNQVTWTEALTWITQGGEPWFTEQRTVEVTVDPTRDAWTLGFTTSFTNVSGDTVRFGSPTTEGRENAGYGGLFWRGPRSFSGGRVYNPDGAGGEERMGTRAPWLAYAGQHDGHGRWSTLVFTSAPDNAPDPARPGEPVQWFVRTGMYACVCPAPFFSTEVPAAPDETLTYRYTVTIVDGDCGPDGAAELAARALP